MNTEGPKFTDLIKPLSVDEIEARKRIDSFSTKESSNLSDFVRLWDMLDLALSPLVKIKGSVNNLNTTNEQRFLCNLTLIANQKQSLNLSFTARNSPATPRSKSTMALYNTKVVINKISGFNPFEYYDSIMYLINKNIPEETLLTLYVRQKDSYEMLEKGLSPEIIPLTKVFIRSGWKFVSYHKLIYATDPLKRHKLKLRS